MKSGVKSNENIISSAINGGVWLSKSGVMAKENQAGGENKYRPG
jgi:hypothetical protein